MINTIRNADMRVSLLLVLINAIAVMICTNEICFIILLVMAFFWLCIRDQIGKGLKFMLGYGMLFVLSHYTLGVRGLETIWMFSNLLRHMLIPIAYTSGFLDTPTGTMLTVFHKLHLPKSFGISTVVLLRFFPTIGYELGAIRSSLKFRGTGVGFWNTLLHLPKNFEHTIVPLLIRTTRISEELSAAAMVRGVRLNNQIISFDEVKFKSSDGLIAIAFGLVSVAICVLDKWL